MWVFLILLALVPLFFFWTDAAVDLIPQWQSALPLSKDSSSISTPIASSPESMMEADRLAGKPVDWIEAQSEKGYAAYLLSPDSHYRLVVGCEASKKAGLTVTQLSGRPFTTEVALDYGYGHLPLAGGAYQGDDLLGAVSQMETIVLRNTQGEAIAQFHTKLQPSESIARQLALNCVR